MPRIRTVLTLFLTFYAAICSAAEPAAPVDAETLQADAIAKRVGHKFSQASGLDRPLVALTFDDGPHPTNTARILAILADQDVKATFFQLGDRMKLYPEATKQAFDAGVEIGTHSWDHPNLTKLGREEVRSQIKRAQEKAGEITGVSPVVFRPPYGSLNKTVRDVCKEQGVVIVNWSVDTNDWRSSSSPYSIIETVETQTRPGSIILMHEIHERSIQALPEVIRTLKEKGFEFVTISELIAAAERAEREAARRGVTIEPESQDNPGATYGIPEVPEKIVIPLDDTDM